MGWTISTSEESVLGPKTNEEHFSLHAQEKKNQICEGITEALEEFIACIKEQTLAQGLARNIVEVKRKLGTSKRYSIGPELDRHIDAIIENSTAVAHMSQDDYREMILRECGEVQGVV